MIPGYTDNLWSLNMPYFLQLDVLISEIERETCNPLSKVRQHMQYLIAINQVKIVEHQQHQSDSE